MGVRKLKIVTVLGARPQFIKAAPVSALIRGKYQGRIQEILVHTGQHYDRNMSNIFFRQMRIPKPKYHLRAGGGSHGAMTGRMMEKIEQILKKEKPDWVLVYGDTNSTLAGALAATKLHIPVAHVEAGLRSFNMRMPEEINRILTDRISSLLFCPTRTAIQNLKKEGVQEGVVLTGDVMFDAARFYRPFAEKIPLKKWGLRQKDYVFCTAHRQENTDNVENLRQILEALRRISHGFRMVFAIHPRTRKVIHGNRDLKEILREGNSDFGIRIAEKERTGKKAVGITVLDPLSYLETQRLVMGAKAVLTDSGGLQKEAFFHRVPCVTLREETEWVETVKSGLNQLAGVSIKKILRAFREVTASPGETRSVFFKTNSCGSSKILHFLMRSPQKRRVK
jgi:UDP-GlcNAc3NAcA epimerase